MPRTKKQPELVNQPAPVQSVNGPPPPLGDILTLAEAAAYLRIPESALLGQIHSQGLPGRLIDGQWRFLKAAIHQWLATGWPTPQTRKAAQLAAAGAFRDDPDLLPIVEEIYRRRGRPITEDGSYNLLHGLETGGLGQ